MTVVAWDGKTLAADKRATDGCANSTTTKIKRLPDGSLIGSCGDTSACREVCAWFERGADPSEFPATQRVSATAAWLLVIRPDGAVDYFQTSPYPGRFEDKFFAIGSGRDFALAAMHLGKDARTAVEVACALTVSCGNGVDALELAL